MAEITGIHPTAVVDPSARLAEDVQIGPYAVIGAEVSIGSGSTVGAGAGIEGPTSIGRDNRIYSHACVGFDPQDLKFAGERTTLEIGDGNIFREFCTVHRGTGHGIGKTEIGDENLFMAYAHVAHDCTVGNGTVFSNGGTLAGHVEVEDAAVIGAYSAVHQFCRVGRHAYIGGYSVITRDALPYVKTVGHKPACYGVNRIGLERKGFTEAAIDEITAAYRILVRSRLGTNTALDRLRTELADSDEVAHLIRFVEMSERGVITNLPGRGGARGGGGGS